MTLLERFCILEKNKSQKNWKSGIGDTQNKFYICSIQCELDLEASEMIHKMYQSKNYANIN